MFRYFLAMVLALAAVAAHAEDRVDPRLEASMLVTGHLDIETDGLVSSLSLDREDELPDYVAGLVKRAAPGWRFEPVVVDGAAVRARARMTLRMLATQVGDGNMAVSISRASFGDRYPKGSDYVSSVRMRPPTYPWTALERNATGTVYVVLKVGRDGKVEDAFVEQINLRGLGPDATMRLLRKAFSNAALDAARRWRFAPPTTGDQVDDPYWSLRVPVEFTMGSEDIEDTSYGKWVAYVPGPRQSAPWAGPDEEEGNDAMTDGSFHQAGTGFRLLTSLQPES